MSVIASDKHVMVVGLGVTGLSCAHFLKKQGVHFSLWDTRENPPQLETVKADFPNVEIILGELEAERLKSVSEIIMSPGLNTKHPALEEAKKAGVTIRGDIDLFVQHAKAPIAAITGSNGKSTVTSLLGEMAKASGKKLGVGGNIGTPALDLLNDQTELYVLELSSFQLELVHKLNAHSVCLLNISEDHMDRYQSKMEYLQAKQRIFLGAKNIIVNDDEPLSRPLVNQQMKLLHYGLDSLDLNKFSYASDRHGAFLYKGFDTLIDVSELKVSGMHNYSNALAALAMGSSLGLPMDAMLSALREFKGLPHRCEFVREIDGVRYINDSKGTNPGATETAIKSFGMAGPDDARVVLIAGGDSKGSSMEPLVKPMSNFGRKAILFGRDADILSTALEGAVELERAKDLHEAVEIASSTALSGDTVLFSPACASFDMFENFEARGRAFCAEVMAR